MTQIKILLVDDDRKLHGLVKMALSTYDATLLFAEDSPEALQIARQQHPDIIVMDLLLPSEMKGWDVIDALKQDAATRHIPIIAMTAASGDQLARGMQAGADELLQKPFSVSQFRQLIDQHLGAREA